MPSSGSPFGGALARLVEYGARCRLQKAENRKPQAKKNSDCLLHSDERHASVAHVVGREPADDKTEKTMTITMTTKAFSTETRRPYRMTVDADGTVRVYDSTAGHYTTCHSMSERSMQIARRKARG